MPKISDKKLVRICVRLWDDTYNDLVEVSNATGVAYNVIIREALRSYMTQLKALERQKLDKLSA